MDNNIPANYFTGENQVSLTATLSEVEVLFSAGDNVKELQGSGALTNLHERCQVLNEASEAKYISLRDRIENVLTAVESKEDEIFEGLAEDGVRGIVTNSDQSESTVAKLGFDTRYLDNHFFLNRALNSKEGKDTENLEKAKEQLLALNSVKISAMESLINLQQGYVDHVEPGDAAALDDLLNFTKKHEKFVKLGAGESESSKLLQGQLSEVVQGLDEAHSTFADYAKVNSERNEVFTNFSNDSADFSDKFKNGLLHHLSSQIVVKENRQRYQKEQFDRLLHASNLRALKNKNATMETFAQEYCRLIEAMIEDSNNYKSPKIQANYDDFGDQTVRPLNSTIFYYFFSADRTKRTIAQWLLSTVRYPNERVRRAYMRFFS